MQESRDIDSYMPKLSADLPVPARFRFPHEQTTYQPCELSRLALWRYGVGDYGPLLKELRAKPRDSYERAAVDRALAIGIDLAVSGMRRGATILDVGCGGGTISRLLAETGYHVTGVDQDIVAGAQEWQDREVLASNRKQMESAGCRLLTTDVVEFLENTAEVFDVALLLSVLHHFLHGYGYSGAGEIAPDRFDALLKSFCSRVRSYLYVEAPGSDEFQEMPPDPTGRFLFPAYFLEAGLGTDVRFIAASVATNGRPRRLYRVDLK